MKNVLCIKYHVVCIKIFFLFILATLYLLLNTAPSAQASDLSLSIDPSIIEIRAAPSSKITTNLKLKNNTDTQVELLTYIKPFKAGSEDASPEYFDPQDFPLLSSIQILENGISIDKLTLGPAQEKKLTLSINIPNDQTIAARPPANSPRPPETDTVEQVAGEAMYHTVLGEVGRDYYFSIFFISQNTLNPNSNASVNRLGIASNVLLSVGSKEIPSLSIEEFSSASFLEKGPVEFTLKIKNNGAHFFKPRGEIIVQNMFGQNIGKIDVASIKVLSNSIRLIPTLWKENFLLGIYTATVNISLSEESPALSRSTRFLIIPFQVIIIILLTVIAITIIKKRVKTAMKKFD